jgi:NAD(P)-dependent dehydrogenase (short-subunit alcohol dehydrogenase family)
MGSLEGKVIAITGAASGIGLALAKVAASRGAKLALADVQREQLEKLVDEIRSLAVDVVGTVLNVTSHKEVESWIDSVVQHFGRVDGAANVAGVEAGRQKGSLTNLTDITNDDWDYVISINLTGVFYCLRAQVKAMAEGGSIVNVASSAGVKGRAGMSPYSASKHGVIGLSRSVAKESDGKKIRVNAVAPYVPVLFLFYFYSISCLALDVLSLAWTIINMSGTAVR